MKAWQVELAPPLLALQSELRILGDHYASVAPILLKCIEHTGQLSGLWLTPDGMANGKPIKELWANRSISLISQNMCHIRLCLGRTSGLTWLQADDFLEANAINSWEMGKFWPPLKVHRYSLGVLEGHGRCTRIIGGCDGGAT